MKNYKYILLLLVCIIVVCTACDNEYSFNKKLSECKNYKDLRMSIEWAPILPIPMDLIVSKRQIKPLPNGDCLLTFKSKSFNDNDYSSTLYYLPGLYAKDFGKLKLDYDKYPDERISRKKAFCKKHLIHCNNLPNHENILKDMGNFYELYSKKKYKNISQQDRNNDIADCKRMSDTLIKVTNDPKFIKEKSYNQYKMISQAIIDDNSNSLVFGEKEYYKTSDQTKKPEWVAEYRTNYSICKAYAYPNGKGFYLYRPVILDPNDKWRGWRGYQYEDYFTLDE